MKKIVLGISKLILTLAFLSIFAWSVSYVHSGGKRLGAFTNVLKQFSEFPNLVLDVFRNTLNSERLMRADPNFKLSNDLDYDVFALNSSYEASKWVTRLINLKDESIMLEWDLKKENYQKKTNTIFSHATPLAPIVLSDSSLIINNGDSYNLYRLDANSEIIWHNTEHLFHHNVNLDSAGNIWACTKKLLQFSPQDFQYWDDYLTQIDVHTGQNLFNKSLSEIFLENGLEYLTHGCNNVWTRKGADPLHLNEIQPVLEDGTNWKEGDLFLSMRNKSALLLYRPSTNKLIRLIQGPFFNQHDVDILSDSTISLFNNNISSLKWNRDVTAEKAAIERLPNPSLNLSAEVLVYNFKDSTYTSLYPKQFVENKIFTETQGLHHVLSNGDLFVESTNEGKIYIFNEEDVLLRKYYTSTNGFIEFPHWVRIYENLDFLTSK